MATHITVLQTEAVEALALTKSSTVVDATLGSGGHAREIVARLGTKGTLIGIDADDTAIGALSEVFGTTTCTTHLVNDNFEHIDSILDLLHIEKVDAILADLGWRMEQFSGNGKGFSFQVDEPLLMTYGNPEKYAFTAKDILNEWSEESIANVLKGYGEERFARRIAHHIVTAREKKEILTTSELVAIIEGAVPMFYQKGRIHPATRTFQALRIAVNDEFGVLERFIAKSIGRLKDGGRIAIITFHSLEDRMVKHHFKNFAYDHHGVVVTKKPITASQDELRTNPRARSAKLRVFEKHEEKT